MSISARSNLGLVLLVFFVACALMGCADVYENPGTDPKPEEKILTFTGAISAVDDQGGGIVCLEGGSTMRPINFQKFRKTLTEAALEKRVIKINYVIRGRGRVKWMVIRDIK